MAISWSDAVADADDPSDLARYERAVSQIRELEPLMASFIEAVKSAGAWPWTYDDNGARMSPGAVTTRSALSTERRVTALHDGSWWLADDGDRTSFVSVHPGHPVAFGRDTDPARIVSSSDFDRILDAIDRTKDWVPRELVGFLRDRGIPIPSD
jgi:hypothetical protein